MDIASVVQEIDVEIARLEKARSLLAESDPPRRVGGPRKAASRRVLSIEAKERIAAAQRKRWAKARMAAKEMSSKATKKLPGLNKTGDVTLKRGATRSAKAEEVSLKKLPGKTKPPTLTLKRGKNKSIASVPSDGSK